MKILTFFFLAFHSFAFSQKDGTNTKNILYGGVQFNSSNVFTLNYEHNYSLLQNNKLRLSASIGLGLGFVDQAKDDMTKRIGIPIQAILLYGKHNNVEFILGFTPTIGKSFTNVLEETPVSYKKYENMYYIGLGYRHILETGIVLRVNPMIEFPSVFNRKSDFVLFFSIGYAL